MPSKTIPKYARYIQVHHRGPTDPSGMLATMLLASAAEWLHARRVKLNLAKFLRNTLVLTLGNENFPLYDIQTDILQN